MISVLGIPVMTKGESMVAVNCAAEAGFFVGVCDGGLSRGLSVGARTCDLVGGRELTIHLSNVQPRFWFP